MNVWMRHSLPGEIPSLLLLRLQNKDAIVAEVSGGDADPLCLLGEMVDHLVKKSAAGWRLGDRPGRNPPGCPEEIPCPEWIRLHSKGHIDVMHPRPRPRPHLHTN